jgi:hypothetical protein
VSDEIVEVLDLDEEDARAERDKDLKDLEEHGEFVYCAESVLEQAQELIDTLPIERNYDHAVVILIRSSVTKDSPEPAFRIVVDDNLNFTQAIGILEMVKMDLACARDTTDDEFEEEDDTAS